MTRNSKIAVAVCVLGGAFCISMIVWIYESPKEMYEKIRDRERSGFRNSFAAAGVPADEHERCLRWAFGDDILRQKRSVWPNRWNERHSDIFIMRDSDDCGESLIAVGKAYCNRPLAITIEGGEDFSIIDCNFVEAEPYFVCPKCQSTALLGKPRPVTIKREVGAVAEVIVDWFCNDCGYPVDSELERN